MSALRRCAILAVCALVSVPGCAVDLALAGGATLPRDEPSAARVMWSGEVRTSLQPAGAIETGSVFLDHLTLGLELQARASQDRGAFYTGGASLGVAFSDGNRQALAQFESGVPLSWNASAQGYYVGLNAGYLWALVPRSPISSANRVLRLLEQRSFMGPMVRYRYLDMHAAPQHDLALGLQMRVTIGTDLL